MSDNNVSDVNQAASGDQGSENQSVPKAAYEKAISQRKADQQKAREAIERVNQLEAEKNVFEETQLAKNKQFEELAHKRSEELQSAQNELTQYKAEVLNGQKKSALKQALGSNINDQYLGLANLNSIQIHDGNIDSESVNEVANQFRNNFPEIFSKPSGNIPGAAPQGYQGEKKSKLSDYTAAELAGKSDDELRILSNAALTK